MKKFGFGIFCLFIILAGCDDSPSNSISSSTDEGSTDSVNDTDTNEDTSEDTSTASLVSTQEMLDRSLLSTGNNVRVKAAIEKVANGEEVTIAYIGGSITEGYTLTAEDSYVVGSYDRFKSRFATGDGSNIHYVNAGMGGTPSTLGMIRYNRDVLEAALAPPDIVFVEFAVNDGDDPTEGAAFESLVRNILLAENKPAVILLFSVFRSEWNLEDRLVPVGQHYQLPMISIKSAVIPEVKAGNITKAEFFRDDYHPTPYGFQIMSETIDHYFATVSELPTDDADITFPEESIIGGQFTGIVPVLPTTELVAGVLEIEPGSFTEVDSSLRTYEYSKNKMIFDTNWHKATKDSNEPFRMSVTCKNLVLTYKKSSFNLFGLAEITIDGKMKQTYPDSVDDAWNNPWTVVLLDEAVAAPHVLEIRMTDASAADMFTILALGYTP